MGDDVKLNYGNNCTALYLQNQTLKTDINDTSNHLMYINNTSIRVRKTNKLQTSSCPLLFTRFIPSSRSKTPSLLWFPVMFPHRHFPDKAHICILPSWCLLLAYTVFKIQIKVTSEKKKLYHVNTNQKKAGSSILLSKQHYLRKRGIVCNGGSFSPSGNVK